MKFQDRTYVRPETSEEKSNGFHGVETALSGSQYFIAVADAVTAALNGR